MARGHFDHMVTAAHAGKTAAELADLAPDALRGVSEGDADHLNAAFAIDTVTKLADDRFHAAARVIRAESVELKHDPGPDAAWTAFFAEAPLAKYQEHPEDFRLDFGPVYYRGRLDGTARVLVVGQDPAANELVGHRIFVGASGQRIQGFLRRIGIGRDYVMINTFLYPIFGQFFQVDHLSHDADIMGYRNALLDRLAEANPLEAVLAVGSAGLDAVERWPGHDGLHVQHLTHPSAHDHAALFESWNEGLDTLRPLIEAEVGAVDDPATYGPDDWTDADHEPIPPRDLPFGVPKWQGEGSHASRGKNADGSTNHKEIIWKAP